MSIHTPDAYLAACARACLGGQALPPWPAAWPDAAGAEVVHRVQFHGIALLLAEHPARLAGWPASVADQVREEARSQTFWEASHQQAIARLIAALAERGIRAAVTKGTALAYSLYDNPAVRRRGDTDLFVLCSGPRSGPAPRSDREAARAALRAAGFAPCQPLRGLQESWECISGEGFGHEIDLHWRMSSSLTIASALDAIDPAAGWIALPRLAPQACAIGPVQNLILGCLNMASHRTFGYFVERDRLREGNRLIWAIDLYRLGAAFGPAQWDELARLARLSGTGEVIRQGLAFTRQVLGLDLADDYLARLGDPAAPQTVACYLQSATKAQRLKMDWAAASNWQERWELLQRHTFPGKQVMLERFPDAGGWPLPALYARRLLAGAIALVKS